MRRSIGAIFGLLCFFFATSVAHSQTSPVWFTLNAPEGSVVTASAPITLRYGQAASSCAYNLAPGLCYGVPLGTPTPETWTSPQIFSPPSGSSTVSVTINNNTFGGDPLPGVYKTVEIQEQSTPQTITVDGQAVTVPALSNSSPSSPTVWFTLNAPEGSVITASAPITLRYGQVASTCAYNLAPGLCYGVPLGTPTPETWTSPQTFSPPSGSSTVSVTVNNNTFGEDPLPGVYKTVEIQEASTTQTITLNGQSVTVPAVGSSTCQLTANPSAISFHNTTVGYTLASSGSLTSNCSSTISVSSVQVSGPYSVSGVQTPFSIAPNQTQNYSVVFAPVAAGAANGAITFVDSDNSGVSVTLSGTGVAAPQNSLSASPTSLSFGSVAVNSSTSLVLTIANSGSTSLSISGITISGTGYTLSGVTTPFTLSANQSKQMTITFSPTSTGNVSGAVTIASSGSSLTVPLSGNGIASAPVHSVSLSWGASSSQISGYNLYRSTTSGSGYSQINSSPITTTNFTDQNVTAGTAYYYVVTAIDGSGVESSYSNEVSVTIPTP
jgi:hypothetical protein